MTRTVSSDLTVFWSFRCC